MNRKKETYDRYLVGERIQKRRQSLGISQEELAERIDRATKYCSDIERGICGMSVETMLSFAENLNMSLDYMMYGIEPEYIETVEPLEASEQDTEQYSPEQIKILRLTDSCSEHQLTCLTRMIELFMEATES